MTDPSHPEGLRLPSNISITSHQDVPLGQKSSCLEFWSALYKKPLPQNVLAMIIQRHLQSTWVGHTTTCLCPCPSTLYRRQRDHSFAYPGQCTKFLTTAVGAIGSCVRSVMFWLLAFRTVSHHTLPPLSSSQQLQHPLL